MTHDDLRNAAEKATNKEWFATDDIVWIAIRELKCCGNYGLPECCGNSIEDYSQEEIAKSSEANAAYIALANPQRILALLDENERMREALTKIQGMDSAIDATPRLVGERTVRRGPFAEIARTALEVNIETSSA